MSGLDKLPRQLVMRIKTCEGLCHTIDSSLCNYFASVISAVHTAFVAEVACTINATLGSEQLITDFPDSLRFSCVLTL